MAPTIGGVETLCSHPATMTHATVPPEIRKARGVGDGIVRLSAGIGNAKDLIGDVLQALSQGD